MGTLNNSNTKPFESELIIEDKFLTPDGFIVVGRIGSGQFKSGDLVTITNQNGEELDFYIISIEKAGRVKADIASAGEDIGMVLQSLKNFSSSELRSKVSAGNKLADPIRQNLLLANGFAGQEEHFQSVFSYAERFPQNMREIQDLLMESNAGDECRDFFMACDMLAFYKGYAATKYYQIGNASRATTKGAAVTSMNAILYVLAKKEGGKGIPIFDCYHPWFQFHNGNAEKHFPRGTIFTNEIKDGGTHVPATEPPYGVLKPGEGKRVCIQMDNPINAAIGDVFNVREKEGLVAIGVVDEILYDVERVEFDRT